MAHENRMSNIDKAYHKCTYGNSFYMENHQFDTCICECASTSQAAALLEFLVFAFAFVLCVFERVYENFLYDVVILGISHFLTLAIQLWFSILSYLRSFDVHNPGRNNLMPIETL